MIVKTEKYETNDTSLKFHDLIKVSFKSGEDPGGSDGKDSACSTGDPGSIPGSGRCPGEGNGNPLQHSCLEPGQWSLVGSSPWGRKEWDTAER